MASRSGAAGRRRRVRATRLGLFVAMAIGTALTGLWWARERPGGDGGDTRAWNMLGLGIGLVATAVWLVSLRHSQRGTTPRPADTGGLPSRHSPAEIGWLLRYGRVTLADLAATIVDLTARGFVLPFRPEGRLVLGRGRPPDDLHDHETLVLDWLFADRAREADLAATRAAIAARPSRWSDLWSHFVDDVEQQGREDGLIERDVASPAVLTVAAAGLALLVAGVVGSAHGYPGWLACALVGSGVVAGATAFARRTADGEALAARWEAFGTELRAGADITPHALAYAVTLGEEAAATERLAGHGDDWPAQVIHDEVERQVVGWREAYLTATSVRGEPSERLRATLSLQALRRRADPSPTDA